MRRELVISEIFRSIQGETSYMGLPCAFVRTAGCNLRCSYCDTPYAQSGEGPRMAVDEICERVRALGCRLVCITGGEPLLQADSTCALARRLLRLGMAVLVETNGSLDISPLPRGAVVIMDVKCPGSGQGDSFLHDNLARLRPKDEVKFVISDRRDFDWAAAFVREHRLLDGPEVLFSPAHGRLSGRELADWILESGLQVRLQIQLHKLLWPERDRGA